MSEKTWKAKSAAEEKKRTKDQEAKAHKNWPPQPCDEARQEELFCWEFGEIGRVNST